MKTVIEQLFCPSHFQKINFNNSELKNYRRNFLFLEPHRKKEWDKKERTTTLMRKVLLSPHKLIVHKNVNLIASQLVLCEVRVCRILLQHIYTVGMPYNTSFHFIDLKESFESYLLGTSIMKSVRKRHKNFLYRFGMITAFRSSLFIIRITQKSLFLFAFFLSCFYLVNGCVHWLFELTWWDFRQILFELCKFLLFDIL